jgi:hypothetical protein
VVGGAERESTRRESTSQCQSCRCDICEILSHRLTVVSEKTARPSSLGPCGHASGASSFGRCQRPSIAEVLESSLKKGSGECII